MELSHSSLFTKAAVTKQIVVSLAAKIPKLQLVCVGIHHIATSMFVKKIKF